MAWDQLCQMRHAGMSIGSHSHRHPYLTRGDTWACVRAATRAISNAKWGAHLNSCVSVW
ncbi:MAG: polysaccharide deacetylase family protein [Gemmatimonadota bacterium]